jgi:hypothetical protein
MPKHRKARAKTSNARDPAVRAAIIGGKYVVTAAVIAAIATIIPSIISSSNQTQSVANQPLSPSTPSPSSDLQSQFNKASFDLASPYAKTVSIGLSTLYVIYVTANRPLRLKVIEVLVNYISVAAPAMPTAANLPDYCLASPPLSYPSGVSLALKIIGNRNPDDIDQQINLTDINLAYATLDDSDFQNVNFSNDLMCRMISYHSSFQGASFDGADLRFARIEQTKGLTARQLDMADSLYKAELPASLFK